MSMRKYVGGSQNNIDTIDEFLHYVRMYERPKQHEAAMIRN